VFVVENGFDNLRSKIGWAYEHLKRFDSLVVEYCRSHPYALTQEDDPVNECHIRRCEFLPVKSDISLTLADVIYSLRSGLDQLAWQLALLGNPNPSRDVMFPIHAERTSNMEDRFRKLVWDMPCEAVAISKSLQPYNRGASYRDDPLWQLNELSNIDKHRLPTGRAVGTNIYFEPKGGIRRDLDYGVEISWPIACKDSVVFEPNIPMLVFGDPLGSPNSVPLELRREDVANVYNYIREKVAPRFTSFFSAPPYPEI
jgi:hypothetical protein